MKVGAPGGSCESPPIVCGSPTLDYNEKWHLTTKIYLANAFGLTPHISQAGETLRNYNCKSCVAMRVLALGVQHPDACAVRLRPLPHSDGEVVSCALTLKSFGLSMPDADNFGSLSLSRIARPAASCMQVVACGRETVIKCPLARSCQLTQGAGDKLDTVWVRHKLHSCQ